MPRCIPRPVDHSVQAFYRAARAQGIDPRAMARRALGLESGRVAITGRLDDWGRFSEDSQQIIEFSFAPGAEEPSERLAWINPLSSLDELVDRKWLNSMTRIVYRDPTTGDWKRLGSSGYLLLTRGWPDESVLGHLWLRELGESLRDLRGGPQRADEISLTELRLLNQAARAHGLDARSFALQVLHPPRARFLLSSPPEAGPLSPASRPIMEFVLSDRGRTHERLAYATPIWSLDDFVHHGSQVLDLCHIIDVANKALLLEGYPIEVYEAWPTEQALGRAGSLWRLRLDGRVGSRVV